MYIKQYARLKLYIKITPFYAVFSMSVFMEVACIFGFFFFTVGATLLHFCCCLFLALPTDVLQLVLFFRKHLVTWTKCI